LIGEETTAADNELGPHLLGVLTPLVPGSKFLVSCPQHKVLGIIVQSWHGPYLEANAIKVAEFEAQKSIFMLIFS